MSKKKTNQNKTGWLGFSILSVMIILFFILKNKENQKLIAARQAQYAAFGIAIPNGFSIYGIDVSHHQEVIAWDAVVNMQIQNIQQSFVFIKATQGVSFIDPFFVQNWKQSKVNHMVRGAYHYFNADKNAALQAQNFMHQVNLLSGDMPPVLDVEDLFGCSIDSIKNGVKIWLNLIEKNYHIKPIIYTNVDFYNQVLGSSFDSYPLWVAHYLVLDKPHINRDWLFWQFSEKGHINGIIHPLDFNIFNGNSIEFKKILLP